MNSRKIIAASFIALSTLTLTSCGMAGKDAPTSKIKQVTDGVEGDIGGVKIRGLVLVSQGDGNAHVVATIVNEDAQADAIASISVGGSAVKLSGESVLNQNAPVTFGGASANAGGVVALAATPSTVVPVTVTLASGGTATLNAIVVEKSGAYANS